MALWAIAALTAYRVALLAFARADLFVDEAQYWLWGQELDWGYYSKPPLVGWVIRAFTDLGGSDSAFWVRLPGPLLHAASALVLIGAAREVTDRAAAGMVGLVYVTMPAVAVGSFLISTDTVLIPFFAGAVWIWLRLARNSDWRLAAGLGLCLGLGMMAKYAAIYFLLCAGLGVLFVPGSRIAPRDAAIALGVFAVVILPNVIWNLTHDLTTLSHTADNVDWVRGAGPSLNIAGAVEFLAAQFAVFGPVLFGAWLVAAVRAFGQADWRLRWLVWMSGPIIALVTVQALLSRAYANWAVTACVGIVLLAVPYLWTRARWLFWAGLVINAALALAAPLAATRADSWRASPEGRLMLRRFVGRAELSRAAIATAEAQGITAVVAGNRDILADLFHTGRDSGLVFYAVPPQGRPHHYYEQEHALPASLHGEVLFVTTDASPNCAGREVGGLSPQKGAYKGQIIRFLVAPAACWQQ